MTSWLCRLVISSLAVAGLVVAGPASAPAQADLKTTAKQYVTDGLKAQAAGRYDEAISLYNKAYELVPHPELLFNLGQAHRLKGEKAVALNYYQKYLAVDARGRGAGEASQWAAQIDAELRAEAEALRKAEEERKAAAARKLQEAREVEAARTREAERRASPPVHQSATSVEAKPAKEAPQQLEGTKQAAPAPYEPRILTTKRIVALGFGGGALVAGGFAFIFRVRANDWNDKYEKVLYMEPWYERDAGRYRSEATRNLSWSNYLALSGIALLGVGGFLWFTGADERKPSSPSASRWVPVVNDEMAGLLLSGGF